MRPSPYWLPVLVMAQVGRGVIAVFVVATLLVAAVGYCIREFATRMAAVSGLYSYTVKGLGPTTGFAAGWSLLVGYGAAPDAGKPGRRTRRGAGPSTAVESAPVAGPEEAPDAPGEAPALAADTEPIAPAVERYSLEDAPTAYERLRDGELSARAVIVPHEQATA